MDFIDARYKINASCSPAIHQCALRNATTARESTNDQQSRAHQCQTCRLRRHRGRTRAADFYRYPASTTLVRFDGISIRSIIGVAGGIPNAFTCSKILVVVDMSKMKNLMFVADVRPPKNLHELIVELADTSTGMIDPSVLP